MYLILKYVNLHSKQSIQFSLNQSIVDSNQQQRDHKNTY